VSGRIPRTELHGPRDLPAGPGARLERVGGPAQARAVGGPPTWPATFTRHAFVVGGESRYHLTGPSGEVHRGYWKMHVIDKPTRIDFANGFPGSDGEPTPEMRPAAGYVTFEATDGGTRMTAVTQFIDLSQMEMMVGMGMAEGMAQAIGQIDALLALASV
jgi:uncharacterized protein YndB with AHSA1/START domain